MFTFIERRREKDREYVRDTSIGCLSNAPNWATQACVPTGIQTFLNFLGALKSNDLHRCEMQLAVRSRQVAWGVGSLPPNQPWGNREAEGRELTETARREMRAECIPVAAQSGQQQEEA